MPENHLDHHLAASSMTDQTARGQVLTAQPPKAQATADPAPKDREPTSRDSTGQGSKGRDSTGQGSTDPASAGTSSKDEQKQIFGQKPPNRFAADVEYSGSTGRHDYLVRVRHRLLDTTFTVVIDGVEHDPKAEMKARPPEESAERAADAETAARVAAGADGDVAAGADGDEAQARDASPPPEADESEALMALGDSRRAPGKGADAALWDDDDLRFTVKDGFATLLCTVRRPRHSGGYVNAEDITLRTVGLGGAGEVDIRHGFKRIVLVPADGSPSAAREEKRAAHPTRYALVAALTKSARYLVPLLGLGALFSGLLDPLLEWIEARVRPALEAIAQMTEPVREWIGQLLRPIQEFLDAVFSPIKEFFAALLRPVADLLAWLLGLLPEIGLPFGIPEWVVDLLVPVVVVVAVFSGTLKGLRSRGERLAAAKAARVAGTGGAGAPTPGGDGGRARSAASGEDGGAESPQLETPDPTLQDGSSTDPLRPQR